MWGKENQDLHFRCPSHALCQLAVAFHITTSTQLPTQIGQVVHQHQAGRRPASVLTEALLVCFSVLYSAVPSCGDCSKVTGQFLTLCLSQGIRAQAHDL